MPRQRCVSDRYSKRYEPIRKCYVGFGCRRDRFRQRYCTHFEMRTRSGVYKIGWYVPTSCTSAARLRQPTVSTDRPEVFPFLIPVVVAHAESAVVAAQLGAVSPRVERVQRAFIPESVRPLDREGAAHIARSRLAQLNDVLEGRGVGCCVGWGGVPRENAPGWWARSRAGRRR